ncbi:MAG: hypothetical protein PHC85_03140 [Candidatus Pacebacteria bacterium]|nr:hypothetical protein [Candidatus Paceibacterota bacterium]
MALSKEQFAEKYKNMPEDVKEAYSSVDTAEILQKIGKNNNLAIVDVGVLADETGLLMLGITLPNKFVANLSERLEVDQPVAQKIASEINSEIFYKIRDSLKRIHDKNFQEFAPKEPNTEPAPRPAEKIMPEIIKPTSVFAPEEKLEIKKQPIEQEAETALKKEAEEKTEKPPTLLSINPAEIKPEETKVSANDLKQQIPNIIEPIKQPEQSKNILEERMKKEIFRSAQEISEKPHPDEKPAEPRKEGQKYPGGADPYREPIK